MHLTDRLLGIALLGSEWVLWLLIALSALSVAIMVERGIYLATPRQDFERFARELLLALSGRDVGGARQLLADLRTPESRVALAGLEQYDRGPEAVSEAMASAKARVRLDLERNLGILGTLGNNAPFIGLFGTVLGIIKAFSDLARNGGAGGMSVVIAPISEALVATAVGLLVAIPAVIAFNYFQGRVRRLIGRVDATAHTILAGVTGDERRKVD